MAKKKRGKRKHHHTGHKRPAKRKHKRPIPEAFKAQWAKNRKHTVAKKKHHTKRKHHSGGGKRRGSRRKHHTQSFSLIPAKSELYDLVGTAAFAAAERKAAAEPEFVINKIPRPIDAIGWAGNIALVARVGAFAARKFLPSIAKPLKHFATGAGHIAAYQLMRNGKLFEPGGAATPWSGPSEAAAPAAGTAPPAEKKAEASSSSSSASTAGYDDDELDIAGLAGDVDDDDFIGADDDDDDGPVYRGGVAVSGDDGEISDTDMSGLPFEQP